MKTPADVSTEIAKIAVIFGIEISRERIAGYLSVLIPQASPDTLCIALTRCAVTCRFFPTPAEIIEATGASAKLRAAEAWAKLDRGDPVTSECIRLVCGGWSAYGQTLEKNLPFVRRDFLAVFPDVVAKRAFEFTHVAPPTAPKAIAS